MAFALLRHVVARARSSSGAVAAAAAARRCYSTRDEVFFPSAADADSADDDSDADEVVSVPPAALRTGRNVSVPSGTEYNVWVFDIPRVGETSRKKLFNLQRSNPDEWTIDRLSSVFGLRKERVRAILELEGMEAEARAAGEELFDDVEEYMASEYGVTEAGHDIIYPPERKPQSTEIVVMAEDVALERKQLERIERGGAARDHAGRAAGGDYGTLDSLRVRPPRDEVTDLASLQIEAPPPGRKPSGRRYILVEQGEGVTDENRKILVRDRDGSLRHPTPFERAKHTQRVNPKYTPGRRVWGSSSYDEWRAFVLRRKQQQQQQQAQQPDADR